MISMNTKYDATVLAQSIFANEVSVQEACSLLDNGVQFANKLATFAKDFAQFRDERILRNLAKTPEEKVVLALILEA